MDCQTKAVGNSCFNYTERWIKGDFKMSENRTADATKTKAIKMTSGSLWRNLFLFSVPLMFAQILEVMFNLSDVAVVGRFADYKALGSVGSTTLLVTLFTGFLIGMGSGVNVQTALALGAKNRKNIEKTVHTSFILCAVIGLVVAVFCYFFAEGMLSLMNTKPELLDAAVRYLKIYALGMPAMAVYNFGNGVMSASGDTKRPLIYLTIAGILNVLLNLFFVIVCQMAASGVAMASAIAQYVSATLIIISLLRRQDACRLQIAKIRLSKETAKQVLKLGMNISFTGVLTFKNARKAIEALKVVPLDRLMLETDCPYMAPEPNRGKRCDSSMIVNVIDKIAEVKGISPEAVAEQTMKNTLKLFSGIK